MKKLLVLAFSILTLSGCYSSIKIELHENVSGDPAVLKFDTLTMVTELETNGSFFYNSLLVHGGWLFATEGSGRIHTFDLNTLDHAGYASVRNSTISSPPVFLNGKMYYLYSKKLIPGLRLVKYDISLGKEESDLKLEIAGNGSLFENGCSLIMVTDRKVSFMDTTGTVSGWIDLPAVVTSRILQSGDLIIAGLSDGSIAEINTTRRDLNCFKTGKNEPVTSFLPIGDNYLVSHFTGGIKLTGRGGYTFWDVETGRIQAEPVIAGGFVIIGDLKGVLYRINLKTGELKSKYETGGLVNLPVTIVEGKVIIPVNDGYLFLLDSTTFKLLQKFETRGRIKTPVMVSGGRLFTGCDNGRILVTGLLNY